MKKKMLLIPVALLLAVSLVAIGCPAPAPAPAPTPAPAPVAPEVIKWRFATFYSAPGSYWVDEITPFIEAVKERTNGRLDIHLYYGGELGIGGRDYLPALRGGAIHLGQASTAYYSKEIEGAAISAMPMIAGNYNESAGLIEGLRPFIDKQLKEKYNVKTLWLVPWALSHVMTKEKVEDFTDLKGMKLRCPQPLTGQVITNCNGVPVAMSMKEVYMAISKGVIDGYVTSLDTIESEKFYEVVNYVNLVGYHGAACVWLMSLEAFNELPADIQKIVNEEAKKAEEAVKAEAGSELATYAEIAKSLGLEVVYPTEADVKGIREAAKPVWDEWYASASPEGRQEFLKALERVGVTYTP